MAATVTFLQNASDPANQSTYTFASQNFGTASSDRYIVVCISSRIGSSTPIPVSSVTVGGVSATIVANIQNMTFVNNVACIAIASVPSGASGDVVVTFPATVLRCGISLFAMTGIDSLAAFDVKSSTATNPTTSLNVPAGGVAIACCDVANLTAATWSGLTERSETNIETVLLMTTAADSFATVQTGLTVTCTWNGSPGGDSNPVGAFASWSPSSSRRRNNFFIFN